MKRSPVGNGAMLTRLFSNKVSDSLVFNLDNSDFIHCSVTKMSLFATVSIDMTC